MKRIKVIIVSGSNIYNDCLVEAVRNADIRYDPIAVMSCEGATALINSNKPDLLIVDLELDWKLLLQQAKKTATPFFLFGNILAPGNIVYEATMLGISDLITVPFTGKVVANKINAIFCHRAG